MLNLNKISNNAAVVDTPLVKIIKRKEYFQMLIMCKDNSVIEHEPFPLTLEGLVAAISLSAEICAGKFFLNKVVVDKSTQDIKMLGVKDEQN